jgi:hypothetical protein
VWNYRVFIAKDAPYHIREVYYDKDNQVDGYVGSGAWPSGDTLEELRKDLEHMLEALDKPVLEEKEGEALGEAH